MPKYRLVLIVALMFVPVVSAFWVPTLSSEGLTLGLHGVDSARPRGEIWALHGEPGIPCEHRLGCHIAVAGESQGFRCVLPQRSLRGDVVYGSGKEATKASNAQSNFIFD